MRTDTHTHWCEGVEKGDHGTQGRWQEAMCHHPLEETPDTRAVGARVSSGQMGVLFREGQADSVISLAKLITPVVPDH